MDYDRLKTLSDDDLKTELRRVTRSEMDEQFNYLGAQRSLLSQKLEGIFSPDREAIFASIRPGGLEEIDAAIDLAQPDAMKERSLLSAYRDLNRVLLHFMDVYEEHVFSDLKHMSKEELNSLYANAEEQKKRADEMLKTPSDFRKVQDATGVLRLAELFKVAITKELDERFGDSPQN